MGENPSPSTSISRHVEWVDTDASGHHHNSAVVRWVEIAEAQLIRELGVSGYFPVSPRVQHVVNFRDALWFEQEITATIWVERMGNTSLTFGFEITGHSCDKSDGGLAADGTITVVHVPDGNKRSAPWPQAISHALSGAKE
ncbi:acyl-CoA thioesterase [Arthrobacter roseus]|uniref:acyl-CoA thioesterase n=1 Tax=Arthrobacter roseus TaxID=136274 RepID=UPI001962A431|nr:thioesterase family protein [Arthrobacter roseus]MBM7847871.1 acyl-CoA thioester hydrolase [Arthrobacter roseus]